MPEGLILLYHRIARPGCDPFGLRVAPERFASQLRLLRERASPLPLAELAERARAGTLPPRAVALSFDDGTPDTLDCARPLLEAHGIPATVFLCPARSRRDYWWEELASLLLRPGRLPERLELRWGGARQVWQLGEDARYDAASARTHLGWRAFAGPPPTPRHALFEELWTRLRPLLPPTRRTALARLRAWARPRERRRQARARPLTAPEIRRLARSPVVRIGAHTIDHPVLAALPPAAQQREIEGSRRRLERTLRVQVDAFAYPYGGPDAFDARTVELVARAGICLACSTEPGRVHAERPPLALPRLAVGDWESDDFGRWLDAWLP